ncbi:MAG: exonuclease SbcCD subunit D [Anaerolineales bacterium]
MSALKALHFSDAHIDIANYGRHDPHTGLPVRVLDFLKSLDEIVDTAIREEVDLVLFTGDAYKDRNPAPTFQREWGRRIMRLSKARIPTLLLVGNHDLSPSLGRAHAMEEYNTLEIPFVRVLAKPEFLGPKDLWDLPLQVVAVPWVARSQMLAFGAVDSTDSAEIYSRLEALLGEQVMGFLDQADTSLPILLMAHASVQGALYGGERSVMLGADLVLSGSLVKDKRWDYVALGHIHKAQDVNQGYKPPVVYSGSIERVDFGEARDDKFFVIVHVEKEKTTYEWRKLDGVRTFFDFRVTLDSPDDVTKKLLAVLPSKSKIKDAIVRLTIDYPRELEPFLDEAALRNAASETFEFHLVKRPQAEARIRIPENQGVGELSAYELLDIYWKSAHIEDDNVIDLLNKLAKDVIEDIPVKD